VSSKDYPEEYFYSKIQQAKIKSLILGALPDDGSIYYHNLIIALAEMLAEFSQQAFIEEVYGQAAAPLVYEQKPTPEWVEPETGATGYEAG
jgi:hypothetical protein